jgi:hypothetical protein
MSRLEPANDAAWAGESGLQRQELAPLVRGTGRGRPWPRRRTRTWWNSEREERHSLRATDEIRADIKALEKETEGLLKEVLE